MGNDAHAVLKMVKYQHGFGKAENSQRKSQFVMVWDGQMLETRRHFVGQVADCAAVKARQFVARCTGRCNQAILPQLGLDEVERVVAVNVLKRKRAIDAILCVACLPRAAQRGRFAALYHDQVGVDADERVARDAFAARDTFQQETVRSARGFAIGRYRCFHVCEQVNADGQQRPAGIVRVVGTFSFPYLLYCIECWIVHRFTYLKSFYPSPTTSFMRCSVAAAMGRKASAPCLRMLSSMGRSFINS